MTDLINSSVQAMYNIPHLIHLNRKVKHVAAIVMTFEIIELQPLNNN